MRFLADENISRLVIERLRLHGFSVSSIAETSPGASDPQVLQMAKDENLILITEDRDFGELVIRQQLPVRGVVLLELDRLSTAGEADRVETCILEIATQIAGSLIVIEPGRVRIRPLTPFQSN